MNKKGLVAAIVSLLVLAVLIGYLAWPRESDGTGSVRIGTILGLTGNNASYGERMLRGFQCALDEINSTGGINKSEVELIVEDSEFVPKKAVDAYHKLTGLQGVQVIVGVTGSKNAIPVCEASKSDNVVIIDALGSAPKLTTHGGPNYFRVMASDALAGRYNVEWAIGNGMKRPAIVYMEDEWGASYRDAIILYLKEKGYGNPPVYGVLAETRDFRTQVEKMKSGDPDCVFLLLYAKEGAAFVQQLRQAGVMAVIYGSDNISSAEFLSGGPEVVEGVLVTMPAPAHGPVYEGFVSRYHDRYGEDPDANIIKSYDAMNVAALAIRRVGYDAKKIRDLLHMSTFEYPGVSGIIKFDANGDLTNQEYTKMIYRSGKLVELK